MSRSVFGWDLPPGVTHRMIEDQFADRPCDVCGHFPDDCICPECPECDAQGDPDCYDENWPLPRRHRSHGLRHSPEQVAGLEERNRLDEEEARSHDYGPEDL